MPVLELRNESGELDDASVLRLLAVMAHPADQVAQAQYLARITEQIHADLELKVRRKYAEDLARYPEAHRVLVSTVGQSLATMLAGLGGFAALSGAPSHEEARDRVFASFWPGSIAAEILINILLLHAHGYGGSVRKAVVVVRKYLATATTESGDSLGGSTRFIQESWRKYRSVAHLWAAHRTWFFDAPDPDHAGGNMDSPLCPFRTETLPGFLSLATTFLSFGANHYPHAARSPTLDPTEAWVVPPDLERPPVTITLGDLEPWKIELLEDYKAEL